MDIVEYYILLLDRNHDGGGVMIYVRVDIPSKEVSKHKFTKNIEAIFY